MTNNDKLRAWIENEVPEEKHADIRERIIRECDISRFTLAFWLYGLSEIPEWELPIIESIVGKKIFEY